MGTFDTGESDQTIDGARWALADSARQRLLRRGIYTRKKENTESYTRHNVGIENTLSPLTPLEPQSRFEDKLLEI